MENPAGLIVIIHQGAERPLGDNEVLAALPEAWLRLPREVFRIGEVVSLKEARASDWEMQRSGLREWFQDEFLPFESEHKDWEVLYFGLAHIPLAAYAGYLIGESRHIRVFQCLRHTIEWKWREESAPQLKFKDDGIPQDSWIQRMEAVIRFGTFATIAASDTTIYCMDNTRQVDIHLEPTDDSPFYSQQQLEQAADEFRLRIHRLNDRLPNITHYHLFAAVPPGLAFLMGKQFSPNKHGQVTVYHYSSDGSPKYIPALKLKDEFQPPTHLEEEEQDLVAEFRNRIDQHFTDSLRPFASECEHAGGHWIPACFQEHSVFFQNPTWDGLHPLKATNLREYDVCTERSIKGEKFIDSMAWQFGDIFLSNLIWAISNAPERMKSIRLFVLHEALHYKTHNATSQQSVGIGEFPKVVEALDYQADVYALLHELAFEISKAEDPAALDHRAAFVSGIETMIATMQSFGRYGDPERMELRRLNRHLIWHYQLARITDEHCSDLAGILKILCLKPEIELKGLQQVIENRRVVVRLRCHNPEELAIGLVVGHKFERPGPEIQTLNLRVLLDGFLQRDTTAIKTVMASLVEKTRTIAPPTTDN